MTPLRWAWTAFLLVPFLLLMLVLVGCTTTGTPPIWGLYAKANYFYGRMEAKAEVLCAPPQAAKLVDICREAKTDQGLIKELAPKIEAELSAEKPDWDRIMQYVGLILSLAAKFIP